MKESEIRPKELFQKYLDLAKKDAQSLNKSFFIKTNCIACESRRIKNIFTKHGFIYQICEDCGTLFCNPRPTQKMLNDFYRNSSSAKFWFNEFLPKVEESRREKIFKKKAIELKNLIIRNKIRANTLCDCGAGSGIYLEEIAKVLPELKLYAIEPCQVSAEILIKKGVTILEKMVEDSTDWHNKFDFVVSMEVFEHVKNPEKFILSLFHLIKKKGYCLVTCLGSEGFDILTLGKNSNSIFPPHHLNFLSIDGFKKLFTRVGFSELKISTPGILDVDIVLNSDKCPEFLKILAKRGNKALEDLQKVFTMHNLSSHVWVLAKK